MSSSLLKWWPQRESRAVARVGARAAQADGCPEAGDCWAPAWSQAGHCACGRSPAGVAVTSGAVLTCSAPELQLSSYPHQGQGTSGEGADALPQKPCKGQFPASCLPHPHQLAATPFFMAAPSASSPSAHGALGKISKSAAQTLGNLLPSGQLSSLPIGRRWHIYNGVSAGWRPQNLLGPGVTAPLAPL